MLKTTKMAAAIAIALLACTSACGESSDPATPGCTQTLYADDDGDGFGDPGAPMQVCDPTAGLVADHSDCNDRDGAVHPGATEVCDAQDNDCDQQVDSADPGIDVGSERDYYRDSDGDGHGAASMPRRSCDQPAGYVVDSTDCNDGAAAAYPGHEEICDGVDNDCDGASDDADDSVDLTGVVPVYADGDGDGFGAGPAIVRCEAPAGAVDNLADCDDTSGAIAPGAPELCDGRDNDCDLGVDGTPAAPNQCTGFARSYSGSYSISAEERLGSSVINSMHCIGTASLTVDFGRAPALQGTVACHYPGGLVIFDHDQVGTIRGDVALDGRFSGVLAHQYSDDLQREYSITGTILAGELFIDGTSTLLPHPQSAVPWVVEYGVAAR